MRISNSSANFLGGIFGVSIIVAVIYFGYIGKLWVYKHWYGLSTEEEVSALKIEVENMKKRVEKLESTKKD